MVLQFSSYSVFIDLLGQQNILHTQRTDFLKPLRDFLGAALSNTIRPTKMMSMPFGWSSYRCRPLWIASPFENMQMTITANCIAKLWFRLHHFFSKCGFLLSLFTAMNFSFWFLAIAVVVVVAIVVIIIIIMPSYCSWPSHARNFYSCFAPKTLKNYENKEKTKKKEELR